MQGLKYANALEKAGAKGWAYPTINVILRNRVYTGAMVQHKSEKISYKVEKYQYIPEEQQYIVEGMHEAIISKDTFEQVQEADEKRTRTPGFNSEVRRNQHQELLFVEIADIISRGLLVGTVMSAVPITKGNTVCYLRQHPGLAGCLSEPAYIQRLHPEASEHPCFCKQIHSKPVLLYIHK